MSAKNKNILIPHHLYTCSKCKMIKSINEFYPDKRCLKGHASCCKICFKLKYKYTKNPERAKLIEFHKTLSKEDKKRNIKLRSKYGISIEEYNTILISQNYSCAICKMSVDKFKRRLSVDHWHKRDNSGKLVKVTPELIRGLLCDFCNRKVLGAIEHSKKRKPLDIISGLVEYSTKNYNKFNH